MATDPSTQPGETEPEPEVGMQLVWYDIDLEQIEPYTTWKPASLKWAKKVNWAKINDLVRNNLAEYSANDPDQALASARRAGLSKRDTEGLYSLYVEPVFATPRQITSGGHRLTAMKAQGLRWGLGTCLVDDIGESVDELHAYPT